MCDKLVFDLAQEIEGSPNVFVRKDWLNILDNQNQNYNNNQSVIDTSQLSNSNKWMNYREAYLSIPMLMSIGLTSTSPVAVQAYVATGGTANQVILPGFSSSSGAQSIDYAYGLKNWFGQIIHSFTLDYNGTTIIQQTPYTNMWNSFRLMTSLSYGDLITQGDVIGFFPDDSTSWEFCIGAGYVQNTAATTAAALGAGSIAPLFRSGCGVCNNTALNSFGREGGLDTNTQFNNYNSGSGNPGLIRRISNINFNVLGVSAQQSLVVATDTVVVPPTSGSTQPSFGQGCYGFCYGDQLQGGGSGKTPASTSSITNSSSTMGLLWKSYVSSVSAYSQQTSIVATVYLKHIHSFFNMVPLLKGVFMKMTMNLNNSSATVNCMSYVTATATALAPLGMTCSSVSVPTGGVLPFIVSSPIYAQSSGATGTAGSINLFPSRVPTGMQGAFTGCTFTYTLNLSVGSTCLNQTLSTSQVLGAGTTVTAPAVSSGNLSKSVYLYIPAYTFNPPFESSYLSSPVKVIKYTDIYQYQVLNIGAGQQFNNLVTNGIANIKSVLILPFYSSSVGGTLTMPVGFGAASNYIPAVTLSSNTGFLSGTPVFQSPFDPAGTGPTSPIVYLTNFNVQVSGQNAIYNVEKYNFEQFNNQLYGQNSVNGGLTDGLTSGLVGRTDFDMSYCYYYINVERMLPVEESVPKSIQILGTNLSSRAIDFYVFVEYGMEIKIDALTGARV
jgi:hypothetical protein